MKVSMAKAIRGFINALKTPDIVINEDARDFEKCLKCFFDFKDVDLLGFDGIFATMESAEDPTNSLFFFKNDTGSFLYQITSAAPKTHKNKLLWDCSTLQIENLEKLNNILGNQNILWTACVKKQIPIAYSIFNNVEIKPNFQRIKKHVLPFGLSKQLIEGANNFISIYTLKLKFSVNPLIDGIVSTLPPNTSDGSFVFLFPLILNTTGNIIKQITSGSLTVDLGELITTYATNLKSIEVLPFFVNMKNGVEMYTINAGDGSGAIAVSDNFENSIYLTSAGIFPTFNIDGEKQQGVSRYRNNGEPFKNLFGKQIGAEQYGQRYFNKILNLGGGSRGFVRTPLANIPLDFNIQTENDENNDFLFFTIKEEGFVISGAFNAIVPPHYINYYTDSSGNIFYANITTNALAFRQLERDFITQEKNANINATTSLFGGLSSIITGLGTGNFKVAGEGVGGLVEGTVGYLGAKQQRQNEYDNQKASLEDKIATESLLAKYTGRQTTGNVTFVDFLESANAAYFAIFFETNYFYASDIIVTQEDYNFSCFEDTSTFDGSEFYDFLYNDIFRSNTSKFGQYETVFSLRAIDRLGLLGNKTKMSNDILIPIRF